MKFILVSLFASAFLFPLFSEEVGVVSFVQGKILLTGPRAKAGGESVRINQILKKEDTIETKDGVCEIQLATQATIRMEKFSKLSLVNLLDPKTKQTTVRAYSGKLFVKAHKQSSSGQNKLTVTSPSFVAGVRGTEFIVALPDAGGVNSDLKLPDGVYVNEGTVAVQKDEKSKEILVKENEEIVVTGKELIKQMLADYAKEKMKIFESLDQIKEENYKLIRDQALKNEETMNQMKGKQNE
ncbi:iron dicitrate transport regulator FecR [Leptospira ognonensis]|uniref:Iron dicitrate transport regulator FecR n=1 Tax=Leptospira ognonensis TaxID=2484945 RepID=A0A4R9K4W7_9LEPT|nr:FecR family protein [Leptospira ognonensis]TGL61199.1 iron dicitrate transport regulator FecR [Leptospira ognonensis]